MQPQTTTPPQDTQQTPQARQRREKTWLVALATIVIIVVAGIAAWLYLQNQYTQDIAEAGQVQITSEGFSPATIKVTKGSVVRWLNEDSSKHRVLGDKPDSAINSDEDLKQGDDYQLMFDEPGTYTYHDPLNPNNHKGTIIVE